MTKPLLMPLLLLFYVLNGKQLDLLIVWALAAAFFGDLFLMWSEKKLLLLAGIVAFLLGHIFYIAAFMDSSRPGEFWLFSLLYLGAGTVIGSNLFKSVKDMRIPIGIYMIVILLMSFIMLARFNTVPFLAFLLPFLESLLFLISDSLLAFDMFTDKKQTNHAGIMYTYILAQALIVFGVVI